jgi:hypothetical protein
LVSQFRSALEFLNEIGLYDVVLPFVLVFTLVFAILEKTRLLGVHEHESFKGRKITKKNLNGMVAMSVAFLVVASTQLVGIINEVMANFALLLVLAICFMLLAGALHSDKEFSLEGREPWMMILMVIMFGGIIYIFLDALDWLSYILWFFQNLDLEWISSLVFLAIVIGLIMFITRDPAKKKESSSSD